MDSVAWRPDERPVVGVVDGEEAPDPPLADVVGPTLEDRDATLVADDLESVLATSPTLVLAEGESVLSSLARCDATPPVLPVGTVDGLPAIPRGRAAPGLESALDGEATERGRPILGVSLEGRDALERERALFDVTLVTEEPARISEFAVRSRGAAVATFRADGVVVATAAGSYGYASAVGTPRLSPAVDAVAVSPIAPFVVRDRRWVLPDDDVALSVERDDSDVVIAVDDIVVAPVPMGVRVSIGVDGVLSALSVPEARLEGAT